MGWTHIFLFPMDSIGGISFGLCPHGFANISSCPALKGTGEIKVPPIFREAHHFLRSLARRMTGQVLKAKSYMLTAGLSAYFRIMKRMKRRLIS